MRILLISANTIRNPHPVYPLGLDYVAGALEPPHTVEIADLNALAPSNHDGGLISRLKQFHPEIIGISLRNVDTSDISDPKGFMAEYKAIVRTVRKHSNAQIVLGGSGFTLFPEQTLKLLKADFGIIGEGERMALFLKVLEKHEDPKSVPGVVTPNGETKFPSPWTYPFSRCGLSKSPHLEFYLKNGGILNLQTKRGCPFRCIYCTYPHVEGRKMRCIPVEEIAETAMKLEKAGAKFLFITDSAFNADWGHSVAVARGLRKIGLSIPWGAFFTPRAPSKDYFETMAKAGLSHVEFGTDSLSDPVLKAYGKPFDSEQVFTAHEAALAAGLKVAHYFLLGGPGETHETLAETLFSADKLQNSVSFFFCGMRIYPNTPLCQMALENGCLKYTQSLIDPVFYESAAIGSDQIMDRIESAAKTRANWIIGGGDEKTKKTVSRMYEQGFTGPLWEYLRRSRDRLGLKAHD